ncbi:hypothetical protein J31TS4_41480 [Paenibacillus sp. J31TS4]|uniref:hypothetical protein n=1 Tax=Paenibacillus sp. J31TS4 TaxID=2807195 RepID=UPI001B1D0B51|nr:hypothetical protein [Paenibacillus sp. J31TS4]GIP40868.1 hypothetical protein J31TS4_41480 [Paenibacillus sp. J31TS4]
MHRIHPVNEETCAPFRGLPVLVVLKDGTQHVGMLSGIQNGQLVLNDDGSSPSVAAKRKARARNSKKPQRTKAKPDAGVNALAPPFGYGPVLGGRLAFDLTDVTLLFLLL